MSSFRLKKNHDDLNNTRSANYGFVKHKNHENARKQKERTLSVRTLGPCGAAMAKKKNLLRPSSFLLRRSPSNVQSVMPLHRLLIGLYDYQACSVGMKMDVYMHRLQELRSQTTVNRSTEFEVTTSLRRNTVCTSVIVGYGVKMKEVFASPCNVRVVTFFSPKLTKTSSILERLLLSSKRSSLSLHRLRDVWALTEKQPVSTSLGVFRHEVARTDLPRKNLNERHQLTWSFVSLAERGSSSEESRMLACAIFFLDFFCRDSFDRDAGQFAAKWLAFLAMARGPHSG